MKWMIAAVVVAMTGCGAEQAQVEPDTTSAPVRAMAANSPLGQAKVAGPLIDHGGPVLATSKTYAIYWGTQADFPADLQAGMTALLSGFNGTGYLGLAQEYMRGAPISTSYLGSVIDTSAPPSNSPRTATLGAEVCKLFPNPDPNAVYVIFTSNAPKINYCAYHDKTTCNGVTFQVAYIPNQAQLPGCSPYTKSNLHCNSYSDGTVTSADSVAHEFMEAITDPHIDAWYDQNGGENADKCNYVYLSCANLSTGSWQIQAEWSNALGGCKQQ